MINDSRMSTKNIPSSLINDVFMIIPRLMFDLDLLQ